MVAVAETKAKKSTKATTGGSAKKKASGEVKVSRVFIEEQPLPRWWDWTKQELSALPKGPGAVLDVINERLTVEGITLRTAYGVRHDQDVHQVWSEAQGMYIEKPKTEHDHLALEIDPPQTVKKLAGIIGMDPEFMRPLKKGGSPVTTNAGGRVPYGWDAMLGYLIHETDRDKYRYSPSEVVTYRGADYREIHAERYRQWRERGAAKQVASTLPTAFYLAELARTGKVTKAQIMATDWMWNAYSIHTNEKSDASKMVDDAFMMYGERQGYLAAAALKRGDFRTSVVYVHGINGTGKSYAAEQFCDQLVTLSEQATGKAWQVYNPAAKNVFDTYMGQEIFFLDEARVDSMTSGEWLMLMDPDRASQQAARYRNKERIAPRVIVITNTTPPLEFFFYAQKKGEIDEAMGQFIRRLTRVVEVHRDNPETQEESWRYSVSSVEHTDPYTHRLMTRRGVASFELNRTFVDEGEYTADALHPVLAQVVDERCHDIDLTTTPGWDIGVRAAEAELAAYRTHRASEGPVAPLEAELDGISDQLAELEKRTRELDEELVYVREAAGDFGEAEFTDAVLARARRDQMEARAGMKSWRRELGSRAAGLLRRRAELVRLDSRASILSEIRYLADVTENLDLDSVGDWYSDQRLADLGARWQAMTTVSAETIDTVIRDVDELNKLGARLNEFSTELRNIRRACVAAGRIPPSAPVKPTGIWRIGDFPVSNDSQPGIVYDYPEADARREAEQVEKGERLRVILSGGAA